MSSLSLLNCKETGDNDDDDLAPKLQSFLMRILYVLQEMQTGEKKYKDGVTIDEITAEMKERFTLKNKARELVELGIEEGIHQGYILERNSKYLGVFALAEEAKKRNKKKNLNAIIEESDADEFADGTDGANVDVKEKFNLMNEMTKNDIEILKVLNNLKKYLEAKNSDGCETDKKKKKKKRQDIKGVPSSSVIGKN